MRTIGDVYGWKRLRPRHGSAGEPWEVAYRKESYFLFIEEIDRISRALGEKLDGPHGGAIEPPDGLHTRVRACGVNACGLLAVMDRIEPLGEEGDIDFAQRGARRAQLREHLAGVPMPRIDLLLTEDEALQAWARLLAPGTWYILGISSLRQKRRGVLACFADTENGLPVRVEEPRRAYADLLLPPRPEHTLRLRDIFSLKHVADAEFGAHTEGDANRSLDPDQGSSLIVAIAEDDRRDEGNTAYMAAE